MGQCLYAMVHFSTHDVAPDGALLACGVGCTHVPGATLIRRVGCRATKRAVDRMRTSVPGGSRMSQCNCNLKKQRVQAQRSPLFCVWEVWD